MPAADEPEPLLEWCHRMVPGFMRRLEYWAAHGSPLQQEFALRMLAKIIADKRVIVRGVLTLPARALDGS